MRTWKRNSRALPFEHYSMVLVQYRRLYRAVNRLRERAGLEPLSSSSLRVRQRIYQPFEPVETEGLSGPAAWPSRRRSPTSGT